MIVVTLSAAYGCGGSRLGPRLAERLGVPFHDRAISAAVAQRLDLPLEDVLAAEQPVGGVGGSRLVQGLAAIGGLWGAPAGHEEVLHDDELRAEACREIKRLADEEGGIFLGRGAAIVLRDREGALHVRLDGPEAARIRQAMRLGGLDRETAAREQARTDRAREAYVRLFFNEDPHNPALYHLILDTTALTQDAALDVLAAAARGRQGRG